MGLRDNLAQPAVQVLRMLEPVVMGPEGDVGGAIALLQGRSEGCVILTEHGKPVGVFTERDVLTKVVAKGLRPDTPITEVMTPAPTVVPEDCTVADVVKVMHQGGFRHLPMVDSSGRVRHVISVKRIVEFLVEHFPEAVFNLPPEPDQKQAVREGA